MLMGVLKVPIILINAAEKKKKTNKHSKSFYTKIFHVHICKNLQEKNNHAEWLMISYFIQFSSPPSLLQVLEVRRLG